MTLAFPTSPRQRLEAKLRLEDFRDRARRWAKLVREGIEWKSAAEQAGLRIAAARDFMRHPTLQASLLPSPVPVPAQQGVPASPTAATVAEIEAAREDRVQAGPPLHRAEDPPEWTSEGAWLKSLPPTPPGWSDAQWRQMHATRRAMAVEDARAALEQEHRQRVHLRRSLRRVS